MAAWVVPVSWFVMIWRKTSGIASLPVSGVTGPPEWCFTATPTYYALGQIIPLTGAPTPTLVCTFLIFSGVNGSMNQSRAFNVPSFVARLLSDGVLTIDIPPSRLLGCTIAM